MNVLGKYKIKEYVQIQRNIKMTSAETQLNEIENAIAQKWQVILKNSILVREIMDGKLTKELYALYMIETYHYTAHNALNQATVGIKHAMKNAVYAKFCFEHASEETGHEKMALHDIRALGILYDQHNLPLPLPETETLIGYLYWISANGNPYRRLGYSLWAENVYQHINPLLTKIQSTLNLTDSQLTFFHAHSKIDDQHIKQVRQMILYTCKKDEDWQALKNVALTSLELTKQMLDGIYLDYQSLINGESSRHESLLCFNDVTQA